jgi:hypothetical protein
MADPDGAPIINGTIIKVQVEHLPKALGAGRTLKTLWLWWSGPATPDLDVCWRAYIHRFDIEHAIRFMKHTLGWTTPRVRTPQQGDRWTWLVLAAYTQLRLARKTVNDNRLPWEPPRDPKRLTPTRVRRGFRQLVQELGTPANPPKPTKAGPGRPKGSTRGHAPRHPPSKKQPPPPKAVKSQAKAPTFTKTGRLEPLFVESGPSASVRIGDLAGIPGWAR